MLFIVMLQERKTAQLVLNDGTVYDGWAFGAFKSTPGEVGELTNNNPVV